MHLFLTGEDTQMAEYLLSNPPAGSGWNPDPRPGIIGMGICERVDDYSAAAFVYCRDAQAVPPVDVDGATVDLGREPYEVVSPLESLLF
jgi:hypothetical protein